MTKHTCPSCGHEFAALAKKLNKLPEPVAFERDGQIRYRSFGLRADGTIYETVGSFPTSAKDMLADRRARDRLLKRYGTVARNAALLAAGFPTLEEQNAEQMRQAAEYKKSYEKEPVV